MVHLSGDNKVDALFMSVLLDGEIGENDILAGEEWLNHTSNADSDIDWELVETPW